MFPPIIFTETAAPFQRARAGDEPSRRYFPAQVNERRKLPKTTELAHERLPGANETASFPSQELI
jgi:hypothetical protein